MTVLTKEEMVDYQKHKDSLEHPEDMRYTDVEPPVGVCKNRYCPEPRARHDDLVRGYCAPCASIRRPTTTKPINSYAKRGGDYRRNFGNYHQDLNRC
jgi:hypothetical protein